jgi:hypothetical protein
MIEEQARFRAVGLNSCWNWLPASDQIAVWLMTPLSSPRLLDHSVATMMEPKHALPPRIVLVSPPVLMAVRPTFRILGRLAWYSRPFLDRVQWAPIQY